LEKSLDFWTPLRAVLLRKEMTHPDCQAAEVIYENLWKNAMADFQANQVQLDSFLKDRGADRRRGITLVARPNQSVSTRIEFLQQHLQEHLPGQYFYKPIELHITILSPFTATDQSELFFARLGDYQKAIDQALEDAGRFSVEFRGITATSSALMVQGFPQGPELNRIRDRLRAVLGYCQLTDGLETRYHMVTAHITFMRFQDRPQNIPHLPTELGRYRTVDFGSQEFQQLQLVRNDWYMSEVEILKDYVLG
jgi:2'-5' RNA ligase